MRARRAARRADRPRRSDASRCPSARRAGADRMGATSAVRPKRKSLDDRTPHERAAAWRARDRPARRSSATPCTSTVFAPRQPSEPSGRSRARASASTPSAACTIQGHVAAACGDTTAATRSPSICSEWLRPNLRTTRTGNRRLERRVQRVVMADGGDAGQQVLQTADPDAIVERVGPGVCKRRVGREARLKVGDPLAHVRRNAAATSGAGTS